MVLRDLKKGDKMYSVFNSSGRIQAGVIRESTVEKAITNNFVTIVYFKNNSYGTGAKAVGYYLGECALNANYLFSTNKHALEVQLKVEESADNYTDILVARNRIVELIKEGK